MSSATELKPDVKLMESLEHKSAAAAVYQVLGGDLKEKGQEEAVPYLHEAIKAVPVGIKDEGKGGVKRVSYRMHQLLSGYTATYYVGSKELRSWYIDALQRNASEAMPRKEALDLASQTAGVPPDAVLETGAYETQGGVPVFVARWEHVVRTIPVEKDYIQVLINGATQKVFGCHKRWHQVDPQPKVR